MTHTVIRDVKAANKYNLCCPAHIIAQSAASESETESAAIWFDHRLACTNRKPTIKKHSLNGGQPRSKWIQDQVKVEECHIAHWVIAISSAWRGQLIMSPSKVSTPRRTSSQARETWPSSLSSSSLCVCMPTIPGGNLSLSRLPLPASLGLSNLATVGFCCTLTGLL